jgi:hypothetical protein
MPLLSGLKLSRSINNTILCDSQEPPGLCKTKHTTMKLWEKEYQQIKNRTIVGNDRELDLVFINMMHGF